MIQDRFRCESTDPQNYVVRAYVALERMSMVSFFCTAIQFLHTAASHIQFSYWDTYEGGFDLKNNLFFIYFLRRISSIKIQFSPHTRSF